MDLRRLHYFVEVASHLHFGRAARRLHMAQPPLSAQIRRLEEDLGVTLFERTTRSVALTAEGAALLPEARSILARVEGFEAMAQELSEGERGVLRIGFVDSATYETMPKLLHQLRQGRPGLEYQLTTMSSDEQVAALADRRIDVGLARTTTGDPAVGSRSLGREPLVLAVDRSHHLAGQPSVGLSQLAGEAFVGFDRQVSPTLHRDLAALLAGHGVSYEPQVEATEYATIVSLAASGFGVGLIPASVQSFAPATVRYVEVDDPQAHLDLLLLWNPESPRGVVSTVMEVADSLVV